MKQVSELFFIKDCNGTIVGNVKGYSTMRGATHQANGFKCKAYKQIWAAYDARKLVDPSNNLVSAIGYKFGSV